MLLKYSQLYSFIMSVRVWKQNLSDKQFLEVEHFLASASLCPHLLLYSSWITCFWPHGTSWRASEIPCFSPTVPTTSHSGLLSLFRTHPNASSAQKPSLHNLLPVKLPHTPAHIHSRSPSSSLCHSPSFTPHFSLPCTILHTHLFVSCPNFSLECKLWGRDAVLLTIIPLVTQEALNKYLVNELPIDK